MVKLQAYVLFDPFTGRVGQLGRGYAVPRDGLLVAEVARDFYELFDRVKSGATLQVDLASVTERGDDPRLARLIEV